MVVTEVGRRDRWRLGLAATAVLLAAADTYVVVVALPSIMDGVGVGLDRLQRATPIISGFLLGYTAVLPLIGRLADLAGTGPVFAGCLVAFGTGSVVTATAHALPVVVLGRAIQGVGGGGLVPVDAGHGRGAVAARRPRSAARHGRRLQELGSVIGPLYGAAIVAVASWRAIFWINVPVVLILGFGFWLAGRVEQPRPDGTSTSPGVAIARSRGGARRRRAGSTSSASCWPWPASDGLLVGLDAPSRLATSPSFGQAYAPETTGAWSPFTTPIVLARSACWCCSSIWEMGGPGRRPSPRTNAEAAAVLTRADLPGALLLAGVLACIVVAFSTADPSSQVVASSAPILGPLAVVLAVLFVVRQRRAAHPLIEPGCPGRPTGLGLPGGESGPGRRLDGGPDRRSPVRPVHRRSELRGVGRPGAGPVSRRGPYRGGHRRRAVPAAGAGAGDRRRRHGPGGRVLRRHDVLEPDRARAAVRDPATSN